MAKQKQKRGSCGTILIVVLVLGVIGAVFGGKEESEVAEKNSQESVETLQTENEQGNDSVWLDGYTDLEDFDYYIDGSEISITEYNGESEKVRVNSTYNVDGKEYNVVSFEDATFIFSDVISVVIPEGTRYLENNTFNSCDIQYLYLPSTLEKPDGTFWGYFHDVEKIYYGGSQEQWAQICEEPRKEIEVKQIFVNVKPETLGTDAAEAEILDTKALETETNFATSDSEQSADNSMDELDLSQEVKDKLYDILENQIGFTNVKYVGRSEIGGSNYDFESDSYDFTVTASDDVYRIFQPSGGATFYEDGQVLITMSDIENWKIGDLERIQYYDIAKEIVKSNLKSPSTADFPTLLFSSSDIAMQRNGNIVAVQSYVDAQNSFGAEIRSNWTVEFEVLNLDTFSYNTLYVNIDGQTAGEFVELD